MSGPGLGAPRVAVDRAMPILAGLIVVAVAVGWSETHSARASLELVGDSVFRCGPMARGTFGRHSWVIRNIGTEPLRLRTRFTSGHSGFSLWQGQQHVIAPGAEVTVYLTWPVPSPGSQPFDNYVILGTNDPTRPEFRLRVVGRSETSAPSP